MNSHGLTFYGKLFAIGVLFLYLVINFYGIRLLAKVNNVVTVLKIFTPFFTISIFLAAHFDKSNFDLVTNHIYTAGSALTALVGAGLLYSFNGFQLSAAFATEIKNPKKNVPLAIVISITVVMSLYMILQLAFMGAVPHKMLMGGWASLNFHSPLVNLAMVLGLNFLMILLISDSVISPSGTGYSYLGGASRMFYAMAVEGQMPKWSIAKINPVYNLCRRSLLINWVLIALVLWNAESWASLMVIVTGYNILGYMAAPISMGAIKPKTRFWGAGVFVLLGLVLTTIPHHDLLLMILSLMVVMIIYGGVQLAQNIQMRNLMALVLPFMVYLWSIYIYQNLIYVGAVSLLFYLIVTSNFFLEFCKKHKKENYTFEEILDEDKE